MRLKQRYRRQRQRPRFRGAPVLPEIGGQPGHHRALPLDGADVVPQRHRPLGGIDGLGGLPDAVVLLGEPFPELGRSGGVQVTTDRQRPLVVHARLAVRAEPGRLRGGNRRVDQHGFPVTGLVGVVGQARRVGAGPGGQPGPHPRVQSGPAPGRDRLLDGEPGELVPEPDALAVDEQQPGPQQLFDVTGKQVEQMQLGPVGHDGRDVERLAGRRAEARRAGEYGVAHGWRYRIIAIGQDLRDEEGVAAGRRVDAFRVETVRRGQLGDGGAGQWRNGQPVHRARRGEIAEDHPELVITVDLVVAERGDDDGAGVGGAPADEEQEIEGRLVGPVHVFEDDHGRHASGEHVEERRERLVSRCLVGNQ